MQINIKLDKSFTQCFNSLLGEKDDFTQKLATLNGFSDSQLNYTDFIDNFVDKKVVADASIDPNANVSSKDICCLETEMSKPHLKLLSFNKIFMELNKKYGYQTAYQWLKDEIFGIFYLHDSYSSSLKPYCFSYDIERLAKEGLFFISNFNNQPPRHLVTFTDFVGEFVSWTSNRTSGACGLASFLIYSYYFWRNDVREGYFVKSPEYYRDQEFQRIVYKLNQPYLRVAQAAFTNFSIFDRSYLIELFGGKEFPDGSFMVDDIEQIIEYQKAFMKVVSDIRSANMMTFPVLTYALLRGDDNKFVDEDFARWCCRHNMKWNDSNFFVSHDITSLSNCCRLVADVKNLGYFNSIGGSALEVGSVKVNTINLARLSYENDREGFFEALKAKTLLCCKTLDVIRHIIRRNSEKGLLPNYTSGIINFKNQYNTIGVIGIYEVLDKYGLVERDELGYARYTDEALDFAKRLFDTIIEAKDGFCSDKDYMVNIEQIPAERAAAVLMEKDRLFHPDEKYELPLYGNQWIPLAVRTTLQEKVKVSALLDRFCNGGSIAHINLDAPIEDEETAWRLLNSVADAGVNYFAFCVRISACEHNHAFYGDVCPHCGGPKVTTYQRIVGYLTPERSYSSVRKSEFRLRDWFDVAGEK